MDFGDVELASSEVSPVARALWLLDSKARLKWALSIKWLGLRSLALGVF